MSQGLKGDSKGEAEEMSVFGTGRGRGRLGSDNLKLGLNSDDLELARANRDKA